MAITAKELAKMLNVSPSAVSIALNNKPGVSPETRERILNAAWHYGYTGRSSKPGSAKRQRRFSLVIFKKQGGKIVEDTPFFSSLTEGIATACQKNGFSLDIRYLYEKSGLEVDVSEIVSTRPDGIILLATEMQPRDFECFRNVEIPMVILDTYFENIAKDYVVINNVQGAFLATNYMIQKYHLQPGYLKSSYSITNFDERADGFYKAVRNNDFSSSGCIVHLLMPTIDGAYSDMKKILESGAPLAACYFADNDIIAMGALHAFRDFGYKVPEDVAIIGFDNTSVSELVEPPLTTINVPKQSMGKLAVERLVTIIDNEEPPIKIELLTNLVLRESL